MHAVRRPAVLDRELEALEVANDLVEVVSRLLTHLTPARDALELIAADIDRFLARPPPT